MTAMMMNWIPSTVYCKFPTVQMKIFNTKAVQILEGLLDRTKGIPGILTNYQQFIKMQVVTLNKQQ